MTEAELQACVLDLAKVMHWRVAHFRQALTAKGWRTPVSADGAGFPDLVLAAPCRHDAIYSQVLFVELKGSGGKVTSAQREWLDLLAPNAAVWTPKEWLDGTIQKVLERPFKPSLRDMIAERFTTQFPPAPDGQILKQTKEQP